MKRSIVTAMALTATAVALGIASLAWPTGTASQDNDQMVNCPQSGRWSIAVWDGPSGTDAQSALDTCAETSVVAAYHLDPDTQGWLRWFAGRPEISNLESLGELQGVLALGGVTTAAEVAEVETITAAQADQMVNCPQPGKWSIAVWDGPSDTDTETALDTCAGAAVIAAYHLDPETQGWLRWFAGRPEISNLSTLDERQGVLALASVTGPPTDGEVSFSVDETVRPAVSELPGFEDGVPRPLASIVDELGNQADFVADELILLTDDPAALDDFLARWEGEILLTFDPVDYAGITATVMNPMYLVRINGALADPAALEADLRALTEGGQGVHRVSSQEGLELLAAAASEAADGLDIGVNWVATGADFRNRTTTEAPPAPTAPGGYSPNTFNWVHLNAGSTQDIGVTEAWRALDIMGRLDNTVRIAVLDMGFEPNDDFPTPWTAISIVPFVFEGGIGTENLLGCGDNPCPWHGTNVVGSGMGLPDNDFGGAGVAGPIAEPIMVFTLYDFASGIVAVATAAVEGADIINMSYSVPVPYIVSWSVYPFELATWAVRESGVLLFAAAGNQGENVDAEDWYGEVAWRTPCENDGVICVGGLARDSRDRHDRSNRGPEHVDIFAPWFNWLGPDPDNPGNIAQEVGGTSMASPYAAGVAALIWAADPGLSADEVQDILYATAHTSLDPEVNRYVNAYDAVMMAMGPAPPQISITSPADGSSHSRGADSIAFIADAIDVEDDTLTVTWTSSIDPGIDTGTPVYRNDLSFGTHTITATATDSDGLTASDTITITIVNDPPIMTITSPEHGEERRQGQTTNLRGTSQDPNTVPVPYEPLPDAQVEWLIDDAPFATGHEASISPGTLSLGPHTISFTGSDGELETTVSHTITIVEDPPGDQPPDLVRILSPDNGDSWPADPVPDARGYYKEVTLVGEAHDIEDGDLTGLSLVWTTSINGGPEETLGTGESVTVRLYAPECTSTHEITLTATDSAGNPETDSITVTVILLC